MAKRKPTPRGEYRVLLDRAVVYRLKERAARESMSTKKTVTWQALLREAALKAAKGGEE